MNKILAFDSSTNSCSVAISYGQNTIFFEQEMRPSMQAERLMVMIENALKAAKIDYSDLTHLAVTVGPGSFTGIRIGMAVAEGIMYATGIKAVGITNFETAFYRLGQQVQHFDYAIIILEAYRNQQYVQIFDKNLNSNTAPKLVNNDEIASLISSLDGKKVCAGSGLASVYNQIKEIDDIMILPRFKTIKALHIARHADDIIKNGTTKSLAPLYIRPPDVSI
jgi:tRNA threonylcarbamoyl adenosine modification protein YeaZ